MDNEAVVSSMVSALIERMRSRDVEGAVALFDEDATLLGSEEGESACGHEDLRTFFERLYQRPHTYGWTWDEITADREGAIVWFVAPATVVERRDDGGQRAAPYRLSGVLRRGSKGDWKFVLFNGSEPLASPA